MQMEIKKVSLHMSLKKMDEKAYNQFRADYSVEQLEQKFKANLVVKE